MHAFLGDFDSAFLAHVQASQASIPKQKQTQSKRAAQHQRHSDVSVFRLLVARCGAFSIESRHRSITPAASAFAHDSSSGG
jgi:hypothetical protein